MRRREPQARRRWSAGLLALAMLMAAGGAGAQLYPPDTPPTVLAPAAEAGVIDLRATYRAAVCRRLPADGPPCDETLLRLAGEGYPPAALPVGDPAQLYRIGFVPGFLAECFDRFLRPFTDTERQLRRKGYAVSYFPVPGRGTAAMDAELFAARLRELPEDPRPFIMFAHSKGLVDTLQLLAAHPAQAQQIAAVVSVAGAANGSPLADRVLDFYRRWIARLPMPGCEAGNGEEMEDLRRDVRLAWWERNGRLIRTPVFSLVATPERGRISPGAWAIYQRLAQIDPRNDGRLIWHDQILPGSRLLGYVNADHWGIASAVSEALPAFGFLARDDVPRTVLVEAAIEVVAATLEEGARR